MGRQGSITYDTYMPYDEYTVFTQKARYVHARTQESGTFFLLLPSSLRRHIEGASPPAGQRFSLGGRHCRANNIGRGPCLPKLCVLDQESIVDPISANPAAPARQAAWVAWALERRGRRMEAGAKIKNRESKGVSCLCSVPVSGGRGGGDDALHCISPIDVRFLCMYVQCCVSIHCLFSGPPQVLLPFASPAAGPRDAM